MATQWERENYHNTFISVDTRTIGNGVWIYFLATCVWHKIKYWCWFAIWSPISLASYAHICIRKTIYPITFFSLSLFSFHSLIATGGPWVRKNTLFRFDFIQLFVFSNLFEIDALLGLMMGFIAEMLEHFYCREDVWII